MATNKITSEMSGPAKDWAGAPKYAKGAKSPEVQMLQQLLSAWGFNPGPVDGNFGAGTERAIRAYQAYLKLPETGIADGQVIEHLQSQTLLDAIRGGMHVPGQPLGAMRLDGPVTLDADKVRTIAPPPAPPAPPPNRPLAPNTLPGGGGGGGGTGGSGNTTQAPPRPKTPKEWEDEVRRKYGSYAWFLDDPNFKEVRDKLVEGAQAGWDEQAMLSQLKGTKYFQTHDANVREYEMLQRSDASTLNANIEKNRVKLEAIASTMGVDINPNQLLAIAQNSVKHKWASDFEFQSAIAAEAMYRPDYGGQIGAYETEAKGVARDYLHSIDDQTAFNFARDIAAGKIGKESVIEHFKAQAKGLLGPDYDAQIDAGLKPRDLLNAQITTISNLMEMNPDDIDLVNDSRFQGIVQHTDEKGKRRPMTVAETSKAVKSLDAWWSTNNANQEVSSKADYLGKVFGRTT